MILSRKAFVVDAAALARPWTIFCHSGDALSGNDAGAFRTYGRYKTVIAPLLKKSELLSSSQRVEGILLMEYLNMKVMNPNNIACVVECANHRRLAFV